MNTDVSILILRRSSLENEVVSLTNELKSKRERYELRNKVQKLKANGYFNRNGHYQNIADLPDYESKWKNSFYVKNRLIAEKYGGYTLSKSSMMIAKEEHINQPYRDENAYIYVSIVVFVEAVMPTSTGPVLKLTDPYGSILTDPLKNTTLDEACTWINRIIVAHIGFNYHKDNHPLKGFQILKFSLHED